MYRDEHSGTLSICLIYRNRVGGSTLEEIIFNVMCQNDPGQWQFRSLEWLQYESRTNFMTKETHRQTLRVPQIS